MVLLPLCQPGIIERYLAVTILPLGISAQFQERFRHRNEAPCDRHVQERVAISVETINFHSCLSQSLDNFGFVSTDRPNERIHTVFLTCIMKVCTCLQECLDNIKVSTTRSIHQRRISLKVRELPIGSFRDQLLNRR